jgi:hypothetical protein
LIFSVNSFDNLYARAFLPVYNGVDRLIGLWIFMGPFMVGTEGFRFKYIHLESCGISVYCISISVYCISNLVLESFSWVRVDGLEVIFSHKVLYFHVVVLYRKILFYRMAMEFPLSAFLIIASLFLRFVCIDFNFCIYEFVL